MKILGDNYRFETEEDIEAVLLIEHLEQTGVYAVPKSGQWYLNRVKRCIQRATYNFRADRFNREILRKVE
jgi:hypothetical protein